MTMQRYMIVETFPSTNLDAIYERLHTKGRMLPEGLEFVESWLAESGDRVFQIMQTADISTFDKWTCHWDDLVDFEIISLRDKPSAKAS